MFRILITVAACAAALTVGGAAPADAAAGANSPASADTLLPDIVVTAQHLDEERSHIQTQTGASTYTIDAHAIAATPGGANTLLNQVVLQAPDVAQDSFGQYHVRGEHAGLQYRINGVILPEGIAVFGQTLDPRLISSISLVTGALPAEYGLRTAGIIDITTKSGLQAPGGFVSLYGGSHGEVQPSVAYGGGAGSFSYFVTADFLRDDLGIESPDGSSNPDADYALDDTHTLPRRDFSAERPFDQRHRLSGAAGGELRQSGRAAVCASACSRSTELRHDAVDDHRQRLSDGVDL